MITSNECTLVTNTSYFLSRISQKVLYYKENNTILITKTQDNDVRLKMDHPEKFLKILKDDSVKKLFLQKH